eukprot:COSAG01_NODE_5881_length_3971_cov_6.184353_7_plen_59_part_00
MGQGQSNFTAPEWADRQTAAASWLASSPGNEVLLARARACIMLAVCRPAEISAVECDE